MLIFELAILLVSLVSPILIQSYPLVILSTIHTKEVSAQFGIVGTKKMRDQIIDCSWPQFDQSVQLGVD
jgi:hypothetical protein